jgi:hypothetical protein
MLLEQLVSFIIEALIHGYKPLRTDLYAYIRYLADGFMYRVD